MFNVKKEYLINPTVDLDGLWTKAEGDKIENFSAVAYFFAKKLHKELKIPIGIIHSSWGGSDIESWISKEKLLNIDGFKNKITFTPNQKSQFKKSIDWFSTQIDRCFESGLYGCDIRIYITKDYYFEVKGIKFEDNVLTLQETKIGQIFKLSNEPNIDMFKEIGTEVGNTLKIKSNNSYKK